MKKKTIKIKVRCRGITQIFFSKIKEILGTRFEVIECEDADYLYTDDKFFMWKPDDPSVLDPQVRIFIASEPHFPDFNLFDYAISYEDLSCLADRTFKVTPAFYLFMLDIKHDIEQQKKFITASSSASLFANEGIDRQKFCNFIYSNSSANPKRDAFFKLLSNYKNVDSLGAHLNNTTTEFVRKSFSENWFEESIFLKKQFKFSIVFENSLHSGYTSEKIASSLLAGTIPIYWGNPDIGKVINTESIINCHDYESFEEVVDVVRAIDHDEQRYRRILETPWFTKQQQIDNLNMKKSFEEFLFNIFDCDLDSARRRGAGPWNSYYEKKMRSLYCSS